MDFAFHKGLNKCRVFTKIPIVLVEPSFVGDFLNIERLKFGSRPQAKAVGLLLLRSGCKFLCNRLFPLMVLQMWEENVAEHLACIFPELH